MQKVFKRVVLVDDDDTSIYLTSKILSKLDFFEELLTFKNGMQALEYFKERFSENTDPKDQDFVMLDINMAVVNGFELLEALSLTNFLENLKIVILSTSEDPNDVDEAAQYRISGYLTKPLNPDKLKNIIDSISNSQPAHA